MVVDHIQILQIKNQKAKMNPINDDVNKCFQYAATTALNHKEIQEKITKNIKN